MTEKTIESEWFEWKDFDLYECGKFQFYECTLKKNIGQFKKGEIISHIFLNYEDCTIELHKNKDDQNGVKFKIRLDILEGLK